MASLASENAKALKFFRALLKEKRNMWGAENPVKFDKATQQQAEAYANALKLKGWLKKLVELEAKAGRIDTGDTAEVDYSFIETFSGGLLKETTTHPHTNNPGGGVTVSPGKETGSAPSTEKAVESAGNGITGFFSDLFGADGIRLLEILGGGILILFGMYALIKKEAPKAPKAVPIPV